MNKSLVENSKNNFGLNLLRFGSVLMVVFGHLMLYRPSASIISSQIAPLFGFLGVEVLLVLSGFLIGKYVLEMLRAEDVPSSVFVWYAFKSIVWRLLPLYYLILIFLVVLAFLFAQMDLVTWQYFFFVQNFSTSMPAFFPESWSVTVVLLGSMVFILLLWLLFSMRPSVRQSKLILTLTIVLI